MPYFAARPQPPPVEAVAWDGTNDRELANLVTRVHGPFPEGVEVTTLVVKPEADAIWLERTARPDWIARKALADEAGVPFRDDERPAIGLHLMIGDVTWYRPEVGEVLVFDPFRPSPHATLFVLTAEAFDTFYEEH
jgi:hypothetical protein